VGTVDALKSQAEFSIGHRDRKIWLWWVGCTTLGYFILGAVTIAVIRFTSGGLLLSAATGMAAVGFMQWFVLRRYIPSIRWLGWVVAIVLGQLVGMIIAFIVTVLVGQLVYRTLGGSMGAISPSAAQLARALVNGTVLGAAIGSAQWLVLRRYLQEAARWIPTTAVAMAISSVVSSLLASTVGLDTLTALPLTMTVTGAIVGAITGIVLAWLLRKPRNMV
jgi:hypothetical protein